MPKEKNKLKKNQEPVKYIYHLDKISPNQNIKFLYHEVLDGCFKLGLDMKSIYMKSLKLFNDIPGDCSKKEYKIRKDILKRYKIKYNKGKKKYLLV